MTATTTTADRASLEGRAAMLCAEAARISAELERFEAAHARGELTVGMLAAMARLAVRATVLEWRGRMLTGDGPVRAARKVLRARRTVR